MDNNKEVKKRKEGEYERSLHWLLGRERKSNNIFLLNLFHTWSDLVINKIKGLNPFKSIPSKSCPFKISIQTKETIAGNQSVTDRKEKEEWLRERGLLLSRSDWVIQDPSFERKVLSQWYHVFNKNCLPSLLPHSLLYNQIP